MTTTAVLIANDDDTPVIFDVDTDAGLDGLYKAVFPDWVPGSSKEMLGFSTFRSRSVQLCYDDMGLYDENNPTNHTAMELWAKLAGRRLDEFRQPLVGRYVVMGLDPDDGETRDVPAEIIEYLGAKRAEAGA